MTTYILCEPSPGEVAHTAISALLKTNSDYHDWAVFMSDISVPTAAHLLDATLKWPRSVEKTETAYNAAFSTDLPFFQHLGQLPERSQQFSRYMRSVTNSEGSHLKHLVQGYDWGALGNALVIDVCLPRVRSMRARAHLDCRLADQPATPQWLLLRLTPNYHLQSRI